METTDKKHTTALGAVLKYGLPLVVSIGLCWLLFRDFDFRDMWHTIVTGCDFRWIALGLVIAVFSHIFRAMRWRIQLQALGVDAPLFFVVLSIFGTYAVNLVFPRLGEVWRTGYIAARQKAPFTTVFGSMVADRLADTLTVLILIFLALAMAYCQIIDYLSQSEATFRAVAALVSSPWLWIGFAAAVAAVVAFFRFNTSSPLVLKLRKAVAELWQGFIVVVSMKGRGRWLLLTVAIWGCFYGQMVVAMKAFAFTDAVLSSGGLTAVLVVFVLSSLSMGVPSNGGIGPWQWAVIFGLGLYGVARPEASAFANLVLGCNTLLLIALGLFTFAATAIDRRSVNPAEKK